MFRVIVFLENKDKADGMFVVQSEWQKATTLFGELQVGWQQLGMSMCGKERPGHP